MDGKKRELRGETTPGKEQRRSNPGKWIAPVSRKLSLAALLLSLELIARIAVEVKQCACGTWRHWLCHMTVLPISVSRCHGERLPGSRIEVSAAPIRRWGSTCSLSHRFLRPPCGGSQCSPGIPPSNFSVPRWQAVPAKGSGSHDPWHPGCSYEGGGCTSHHSRHTGAWNEARCSAVYDACPGIFRCAGSIGWLPPQRARSSDRQRIACHDGLLRCDPTSPARLGARRPLTAHHFARSVRTAIFHHQQGPSPSAYPHSLGGLRRFGFTLLPSVRRTSPSSIEIYDHTHGGKPAASPSTRV